MAPRPAPHRTQHRSAPSEPGFRFVPCFENSIKSDFVLCGAPPRATPSPAPLRSLRAWSPFRDMPSFETSAKRFFFCFVWRPAPRHTVPSTAPLPESLGSVSRVHKLREFYKNRFESGSLGLRTVSRIKFGTDIRQLFAIGQINKKLLYQYTYTFSSFSE